MKFKRWEGGGQSGYSFWCQGCDDVHSVRTEGSTAWIFNGDVDRPVLSPSVLVTGVKRLTDEQHAAFMRGEPLPEPTPTRCHSFVGCNGARPGQIIFLSDCTHALTGQTLDLPEWRAP